MDQLDSSSAAARGATVTMMHHSADDYSASEKQVHCCVIRQPNVKDGALVASQQQLQHNGTKSVSSSDSAAPHVASREYRDHRLMSQKMGNDIKLTHENSHNIQSIANKRRSFENGLQELGNDASDEMMEGWQNVVNSASSLKRKANPVVMQQIGSMPKGHLRSYSGGASIASGTTSPSITSTTTTTATQCVQTAPLCETPPLPSLTPVPLGTLHDHLLHLTKKLHLYKLHIQDTERQMKSLQDKNDILAHKLKTWRDFRKYLMENEHLKPVRDLLEKWIKEMGTSSLSTGGATTDDSQGSSQDFSHSRLAPKEREEHPYKSLSRTSKFMRRDIISSNIPDPSHPLSEPDVESNARSQQLLNQSDIVLNDTKLEEFLKHYHAEYFMLHNVHSTHVGRYYLWMQQQEKMDKEQPTVLEDEELDELMDLLPQVNSCPASPPAPQDEPTPITRDQAVEVTTFEESPPSILPPPQESYNSISQIKLDQAKTEIRRQKLEMERQRREISYLKHQLRGVREIEKNRIRSELTLGTATTFGGGIAVEQRDQRYPTHIFEVQPTHPSTLQKQTSSGHLLERLKKIKTKYSVPNSISAKSIVNSPPKEGEDEDVTSLSSKDSVISTPSLPLGIHVEKHNPSLIAESYNIVSPQIGDQHPVAEISSPRLRRPSTSGPVGFRRKRRSLKSASGARRSAHPGTGRTQSSKQMSMESFLEALPASDKPRKIDKSLSTKKDGSTEKFSYDPNDDHVRLSPRPPSTPRAPSGAPRSNSAAPRRWKTSAPRPQTGKKD